MKKAFAPGWNDVSVHARSSRRMTDQGDRFRISTEGLYIHHFTVSHVSHICICLYVSHIDLYLNVIPDPTQRQTLIFETVIAVSLTVFRAQKSQSSQSKGSIEQ